MPSKSIQDHVEMLLMLRLISRVNEYVINEYHHELIQIRPEDTVHQVHESGRGVGQPKRHDQELVVAVPCAKGCLGDVGLPNPQLMAA
jgi:hypothetical protein